MTFATEITLTGPFRSPAQMLADQVVDEHTSVHDEGTAASLGLAGAPMNPTTGRIYRGINNLLLGMMQDAAFNGDPRWCSYRQAQARGWQVRKGEHGIGILAPMVRRSTDEATGEDTRAVVGFRAATVFDVAQTDGAELATPCHQLEGETSRELVLSLVRAIQAEGYWVESAGREEIGSANGDTTPSLKRVRVAADLSPAQTFKTLAHERGHVLLHVDGGDQTCREGRELEAEKRAMLAEKQAMAEFSTPEQIGALAVFLCSEAARTITGAPMSIDGGWVAQ